MDVTLALRLSKIVHAKCKDVPHDIGMSLALAVERHTPGVEDCTCEFVQAGNYCHAFRKGRCANKEHHKPEHDPTGEKVFCDSCKHFPAPDSKTWEKTTMGGLHVCEHGTPMLFKMPHTHPDTCDWGFYHKRCRFFEPDMRKTKANPYIKE